MSEPKHTPGPWALGIETCDDSAQVIAVDGSHVATVACDPVLANARLIAAAPDMLAALERVSGALQRGRYPELQGIACDVFAAIDKATGRD